MGPELGRLGDLLRRRDLTVAVAESMTGGLLAAALADLPESSQRFLGGVVSYRTDKKMDLLGVPEDVIARDGVVSGPAARLMADGARRLFHAGVAISVTGVAGPQRQEGKPVGLTYIGVSLDGSWPDDFTRDFSVKAVTQTKLERLFSPGIWPRIIADTNTTSLFFTRHFIPQPAPAPPPPTTRKIDITYLGFYQTDAHPRQVMVQLADALVDKPIGARVSTNWFFADATVQALTLTNVAGQTTLLPLNTKKEIEVPIQ